MNNQELIITDDIVNELQIEEKNILFITGADSYDSFDIHNRINELWRDKNWKHIRVQGEPTVKLVDEIVANLLSVDIVIGLGGGSVLDTAKAVSAIFVDKGSIKDYLPGIGDKTISGKRVKLWLCPTTAGTGAESSNNAVIADFEEGYKKSIRHDGLIADKVIIDRTLNAKAPRNITSSSGMDAFVQLLEAYFSHKEDDKLRKLIEEAIVDFIKYFPIVLKNGNNLDGRFKVSLSAYVSGIVITQLGIGVVHGISGPLGGLTKINHGIICARLIYPTLKALHTKALETNNSVFLERYNKLSSLLDKDLLEVVDLLNVVINIPNWDTYKISDEIKEKVYYEGINRESLVVLSKEEVLAIF